MAEEGMQTYIQILMQSLDKKLQVMKRIEASSKEQEEVLSMQEPDMDWFERIMDEKGEAIQELEELDRGFDSVFGKVKERLEADKATYRTQIEKMQGQIRDITDVNVRLQALEQKNKEKLAVYLATNRAAIKRFKVNSQTAGSYYKNMANRHQTGQSYFLDKQS